MGNDEKDLNLKSEELTMVFTDFRLWKNCQKINSSV